MAGIYRAKDAFAYTDDAGVPRVVRAGDLFHGTDPCVAKRPGLFEPAETAATRAVETASAAPGELRSVAKKAPTKKTAASQASEADDK